MRRPCVQGVDSAVAAVSAFAVSPWGRSPDPPSLEGDMRRPCGQGVGEAVAAVYDIKQVALVPRLIHKINGKSYDFAQGGLPQTSWICYISCKNHYTMPWSLTRRSDCFSLRIPLSMGYQRTSR